MIYVAKLKILNYNKEYTRYEFQWGGHLMISRVEDVELRIEGLSEEDVYENIAQDSEGTLLLVELTKETEEEEDSLQYTIDICTPLRNSDIIYIATKNATIGKN